MAKIITREQWERRIRSAGEGMYDFVRWQVDGKFGAKHKCVVRCLIDGFEWSPISNNIVNKGVGCPRCAGNIRFTSEKRVIQINKLNNIEFLSWVDDYKNQGSKAIVRCKIDSFVWEASVRDIVNKGSGCPNCASNRRFTPEERVDQINKLENIEFVSWPDLYKNKKSKVKVRCKVDGFCWSTSIDTIVSGSGCPRCAKTGYDPSKTGYLYAMRSECGQYVKVGISNDPKRRHKELERRTPFKFNLVERISGDGAKIAELEKHFHSKYERAGFTGFDGCTEWLICTPELLEELRNLGD